MFKFSRDLMPQIDDVASRRREAFPEIDSDTFWHYYDRCIDFSLLHATGFYNLYQSMLYIKRNNIPGNAVECGCFLGGAAAFLGLMRTELGLGNMEIVLFDTFEGPPVGSEDIMLGQKIETPAKLPSYRQQVEDTIIDVVGSSIGYRFVSGLVEETLPLEKPHDLALLRLDTDFYSSTKIELETLYPNLITGGVIIVDDYGLFQGSRKATDDYFLGLPKPPLLNRIDAGVWAGVKPA